MIICLCIVKETQLCLPKDLMSPAVFTRCHLLHPSHALSEMSYSPHSPISKSPKSTYGGTMEQGGGLTPPFSFRKRIF